MIHFGALDFCECRSEKVMFLLILSIQVLQIYLYLMTSLFKLFKF